MALLEKLQDIKIIKDEIKNSIENKGVDTTNAAFADYPELIESIQSGGGSEDWRFSGVTYLFDYLDNYDNTLAFDEIIKHFPEQPTSLKYTFRSNFSDPWITNEQFKKITELDLTQCKALNYAFQGLGFELYGKYDLYLPNCTDMSSAFYMWKSNRSGYTNPNGQVSLDFHGTTGKVAMFSSCFGSNGSSYLSNFGEILNINMDSCINCSSIVTYSNVTRFTFAGSLGSLSTSSSLTLDLSSTKMDYVGVLETFNTISENTSEKTRTIRVKSQIYDVLTEDDFAIATNKGYTITSS